jgi:hypothetical protein
MKVGNSTIFVLIATGGLALWAACQKQPEPILSPAPVPDLAVRFEAAVRSKAPDLKVTVLDPDTLKIKTPGEIEGQVSLDNLKLACQSDPASCDAAIAHFAQVTVNTFSSLGEQAAPSREQIRAMLKDDGYIQGLKKALAEGPADKAVDNAVLHEKFLGDLWIVYVLDQPTATALLNKGALKDLGLAEDALHGVALENMRKALLPIPTQAVEGVSGLYGVEAGDSYEAARLLLHEAWKPLADKVSGELIACAPIRDVVLYAGSEDAPALTAMRSIAAKMMRAEPYPLSAGLLRWTPQGWQEFRP